MPLPEVTNVQFTRAHFQKPPPVDHLFGETCSERDHFIRMFNTVFSVETKPPPLESRTGDVAGAAEGRRCAVSRGADDGDSRWLVQNPAAGGPELRASHPRVRSVVQLPRCELSPCIPRPKLVAGRADSSTQPWNALCRVQTEYMSEHGYEKFSTWFDTKVWHPIGRPVGTTTYPGMMLTSASLHRALNVGPSPALPPARACIVRSTSDLTLHFLWQALGYEISLNDVCVFIPAWFSCLTCVFPPPSGMSWLSSSAKLSLFLTRSRGA
jgi:hypothetical protein